MKRLQILSLAIVLFCGAVFFASAERASNTDCRARFFQLCDRAAGKVRDAESKGPYLVVSYAVRALCVAHDMTGKEWPPTKGWGMKFGGLPFHECVFSPRRPDGAQWAALGDAGLHRLEAIFDKDPSRTQLSMFMLMSCAERPGPGGIYRTVREHSPFGP